MGEDGRSTELYGVSKEKAAAHKEYEGRRVNSENVGLVESRLVVVCGGGEVSGGLWWRVGQWWCVVEGRSVVVCGGGEVSGGVWWRGGQWWCVVEGRSVVVCGGGEVSGGVWWRGGQWWCVVEGRSVVVVFACSYVCTSLAD